MTLNGTTECLIPVEICNLAFSGQVFPFVEDLESSQNATKAAKPKYVNLICTFVFTQKLVPCQLPTIYSPEIRAFAGGDVSSKHFQTVLLSRRERHVTSLENLKFFRKDQQSTKDQQLLTFFCKDIVSCKSGNSSVWPRRSWKLASSVKTDPSVTLKKKLEPRKIYILCHLLKFLSKTTLSPLSAREVAPQIFVGSFLVDLAFS